MKSTTRQQLAWTHARGCKKSLSDCHSCQANIEWFKSLPLAELSLILQESQAPSMPASLPVHPNKEERRPL